MESSSFFKSRQYLTGFVYTFILDTFEQTIYLHLWLFPRNSKLLSVFLILHFVLIAKEVSKIYKLGTPSSVTTVLHTIVSTQPYSEGWHLF